MRIQNILPLVLRLHLQVMKRAVIDRSKGRKRRFAKEKSLTLKIKYETKLRQEFKKSTLHSNKLHNIKLASQKIKKVVIEPGEIFSFWEILKQPSKKNGFKKGRIISNGRVDEDYGGGLCQLSGIIYHLCLIAKLEILERHNHSVDIYNETTRFTPLGADATVAYGYKDLRFVNSFNFPISWSFEIDENSITAILLTPQAIVKESISFIKKEMINSIEVTTLNQNQDVLALSNYAKY